MRRGGVGDLRGLLTLLGEAVAVLRLGRLWLLRPRGCRAGLGGRIRERARHRLRLNRPLGCGSGRGGLERGRQRRQPGLRTGGRGPGLVGGGASWGSGVKASDGTASATGTASAIGAASATGAGFATGAGPGWAGSGVALPEAESVTGAASEGVVSAGTASVGAASNGAGAPVEASSSDGELSASPEEASGAPGASSVPADAMDVSPKGLLEASAESSTDSPGSPESVEAAQSPESEASELSGASGASGASASARGPAAASAASAPEPSAEEDVAEGDVMVPLSGSEADCSSEAVSGTEVGSASGTEAVGAAAGSPRVAAAAASSCSNSRFSAEGEKRIVAPLSMSPPPKAWPSSMGRWASGAGVGGAGAGKAGGEWVTRWVPASGPGPGAAAWGSSSAGTPGLRQPGHVEGLAVRRRGRRQRNPRAAALLRGRSRGRGRSGGGRGVLRALGVPGGRGVVDGELTRGLGIGVGPILVARVPAGAELVLVAVHRFPFVRL